MDNRKSPRYQGRITSWKDDQGFGFITPNGGGPTVFVHIKSFASGEISQHRRPEGNEIVTYDLTVNDKGQARAANVAFVRSAQARRAPARPGTGTAPLLAAGAFLILVVLLVMAGKLPALVLAVYAILGAVAFAAYAGDKAAAQAGRRRTPESTLHLLGLMGGWPGALLAQRTFRHKTTKASFRTEFWFTVAINCAVLAWLATPSGAAVLRSVLGTA